MNYLLRDIEPKLWKRAKARADAEGRTLRGLILWLLTQYVSEAAK